MNMENKKTGYILIYRSIFETGLYPKKRKFTEFEAWMDLLLRTNYKNNKLLFDMKFIDVLRGQLLTSELKLSTRWMWSRDKVRSFLKLLQNDAMITKESFNKYTIITICNYDNYQNITTTEPTTEPTQIIKVKKVNKKKVIINIEQAQENLKKELEHFIPTYGKEMLNAFYIYWSEANTEKTKCKYQMQATWETNKRLATWNRNNFNKKD